jgi:molybdopterin molybdotransferase
VVPVEDTDFGEDQHASLPDQVAIYRAVEAGQYVRPRGQDIQQGQVLLQPGRKLLPQDIGLLASIGRTSVSAFRRPRVALFSSGDELVQPGQALQPGQIYDSNQYVLAAMLENSGAEVLRLGTAHDDPQGIYQMLQTVREQQVDLILTSAGVSVGAFDYVRQVIQAHGRLSFWRVNMRPGKPLAFGYFEEIPLIGLPGNPVSAYVGCRVFVLPAVYRLAGRSQEAPRRVKASLAHTLESDGRESYLRAVVQEKHGRLVANLTGQQSSGNLFSLVQANALLIVPSGVKSLPLDSEVDIWFLENE